MFVFQLAQKNTIFVSTEINQRPINNVYEYESDKVNVSTSMRQRMNMRVTVSNLRKK